MEMKYLFCLRTLTNIFSFFLIFFLCRNSTLDFLEMKWAFEN